MRKLTKDTIRTILKTKSVSTALSIRKTGGAKKKKKIKDTQWKRDFPMNPLIFHAELKFFYCILSL